MTAASSLGRTLARRVAHRVASRVADEVRRVDHAVGRLAGARRILVEARTPMNLAVIRPVLDRLRSDPRIRLLFTGPDRPDLRAAFEELGVADNVIGRHKATWTRFDLYVNSDPWEAVALRRVSRRLNFFHGVAGKYDLDCPAHLPLGFDRYDAVAFPNAGRRDAYVAAGIVPADRARLIGYPKIDALVNASSNARRQAAALSLDSSRPTVIFAPTFSAASALNHAGEEIIATLLTAGCNVVAKLHDRSLDPDPRFTGGINWRARLAPLSGPQFLLASGGDSTPYVLASDVMVTDHSSIGFERYDAVAFPNAARRDAYVDAGIVSADRARLIGYPKIDALVNDRGNARARAAALGLDASRPTVIFAPTFSPASALNHAGEEIVRVLLGSGRNVIAKLHDRSLDQDPKYSGGVNWRERLGRYAGGHFLLAASGDSTPFVLASDVMVTDHSSIGFEFCALDRPVIVYDAPDLIETARINRQKVELLRSAALVVRDPAALAGAVRDALAAPAALAAPRARAAGEVFFGPGGATARALQLIYDLIDLPAAALEAPGTVRAA